MITKNLICAVLLFAVTPAFAGEVFHEEFERLDAWEPLTFPKVEQHSQYRIEEKDGASVLRAESEASASGLVSKATIDVYEYPELSWRWKVANIYTNTDVLSKEGDDYPIRIYVLFEYDPDRASLRQRIQYRAARLLYGEYPPHSTLNYVWASAEDAPKVYPNPFTDRARMIPLRRGTAQVGEWVEESVHILEDYRRVFGEEPPRQARIAIMNDSDNTGEASVSWVDWIRTPRPKRICSPILFAVPLHAPSMLRSHFDKCDPAQGGLDDSFSKALRRGSLDLASR